MFMSFVCVYIYIYICVCVYMCVYVYKYILYIFEIYVYIKHYNGERKVKNWLDGYGKTRLKDLQNSGPYLYTLSTHKKYMFQLCWRYINELWESCKEGLMLFMSSLLSTVYQSIVVGAIQFRLCGPLIHSLLIVWQTQEWTQLPVLEELEAARENHRTEHPKCTSTSSPTTSGQ